MLPFFFFIIIDAIMTIPVAFHLSVAVKYLQLGAT
jgi:hypothetical protein